MPNSDEFAMSSSRVMGCASRWFNAAWRADGLRMVAEEVAAREASARGDAALALVGRDERRLLWGGEKAAGAPVAA